MHSAREGQSSQSGTTEGQTDTSNAEKKDESKKEN
jgi:hypothetical protein